MNRLRLLSLISAAAVAAAALGSCAVEEPEPEKTKPPAEVKMIDPAEIRAQDDFYGYVNAQYLLDTLPPYGEETTGVFGEVEQQTEEELMLILDEIINGDEEYETGSTEYLIKNVYEQAMAHSDNSAFMEEIKGVIADIEAAGDINALMELWRELSRTYRVPLPIGISVYQNYFKAGENCMIIQQTAAIGSTDLKEINEKESACVEMRNELSDLLLPFVKDSDTADAMAKSAVYLALEIAAATDFSVQEAADPFTTVEFVSDDEIDAVFTQLDKSVFEIFTGLSENPYGGCYIQDLTQLEKMNELMTGEHLEQWKTLLTAQLVSANAEFLATEADSLAGLEKKDSKGREHQVMFSLVTLFYDELSPIYAQKYYTPEADAALREMCEEIRQSYRELITAADWLSQEGRASLLRKLENITFVLGSDEREETDPEDAKLIADTYPETVKNFNKHAFDEDLALIGEPRDINMAGMSSFEVNACYDPNNTVTITVAIMHPPFFDVGASKGTNLGGLGDVVGHEMGHAFDSHCMDFDENGNYDPEWLSEEDRNVLAERAEKMQDYFSSYTVMDIYHVDGEKTGGENYADLGAVECIVNILKDDDEGLRDFFESLAGSWAECKTDLSAIQQLENDEHSPEKIRVNAVLSSCDKFYEIYDVREGDGMYRAPEERVSRW